MASAPLDYASVRRALVASVALAAGVPAERVVRAEGQGPVQPRPPLPYIAFKVRRAAIRNGRDAVVYAPELGPTTWRYVGERGLGVDLTAFGRDQDEAYTLAAQMQAALDAEPCAEVLNAGGLSLWSVGDVVDVTALLGSGFEARALLEIEVWAGTELIVDLGEIATVPIVGDIVLDDTRGSLRDAFTVNLEG
jgi:hypothetical protein